MAETRFRPTRTGPSCRKSGTRKENSPGAGPGRQIQVHAIECGGSAAHPTSRSRHHSPIPAGNAATMQHLARGDAFKTTKRRLWFPQRHPPRPVPELKAQRHGSSCAREFVLPAASLPRGIPMNLVRGHLPVPRVVCRRSILFRRLPARRLTRRESP